MKTVSRRTALQSALAAMSGLGAGCGGGEAEGEVAGAGLESPAGTGAVPVAGAGTTGTVPKAPPAPVPPPTRVPPPTPAPPPAVVPPQSSAPLALGFDAETPEQISIYCPTTRAVPDSTWVQVRYKPVASSSWSTAHPLLHIMPAWVTAGAPGRVVDAFAGAIFDLVPSTSYDVELTINEPNRAPRMVTGRRATRALPPAAGPVTVTATPADNLAAKIASLRPGSVLQLANGTYIVNGLRVGVAGTAAQPIYIRGANRASVVIVDTTDTVIQVLAASHIVIEDLTIRGSGVDSGVNSSSSGIIFHSGSGVQTNVTVRRVSFEQVDKGIKAYARIDGCLVYECTLNGNNPWREAYTVDPASGYANHTWNDDGICLPGLGNCAWNNTLRGFGDSFAVFDGVLSAGVYFYRNKIEMTCDDAFEADYATRNIGWYDNYIANCATFLSLDPLWGGPLYAFRNVCINTIRGPFKWTSQNTGHLIYNNTIIRTDGTTTAGWTQANNGTQRGWAYRNNLLVYHGTGAATMHFNAGAANVDFTHNSWFPNRQFNWPPSGGGYPSLAAAQAGLTNVGGLYTNLRRHTNDTLLSAQPWTTLIMVETSHANEYTAMQVPTLASGSVALGAGVEIPGITDGHVGVAPDRGAVIGGRLTPQWGASQQQA